MTAYTIEPPTRLYRTRPGIVTALGVACIIVAALSGVASSVVGMYGFGSLWILRMVTGYGTSAVYGAAGAPTPTRLTGRPGAPMAPSGATPAAPGPLAPAGIVSSAARRQIVKDVDAFHPLAASRQSQFEKLLAEVGQAVGFTLSTNGTPVSVRRDLIDSGKAPGTQPSDRDMDYLTTRAGRIELTESYATFTSIDGTVSYRTAVGTAGFGPAITSWTLGADEVQQVMTQVQQSQTQGQGQLNPSQMQALQAALQSPGQRLVQPGMAQMMWMQTSVDANGVATVSFNNSAVVIAKQGVIVSTGPAPIPPGFQQASPEAAGLVVFESGMSLALAIFLFVTGILLLRQSPVAVRLLKYYAVTKLPLAILGGIAVAWLWGSFSAAMMSAPTDSDRATATAWGIGLAIAGLVFPLAILAMLASPGVKEYFTVGRRGGS
jgi:hypothetical protein